MAKIVIIGAGSHFFAKGLITDIVMYPELRDSVITLVDIDKERLDLIAAFARKLVDQNGLETRIESTLNRREALADADYVVNTIKVGGSAHDTAAIGKQPLIMDRKVVMKYGLEWDDTLGPCGVFYALRHIPIILDICHDIEEVCPNAWFLNFSNPMAMICWAINDYTRTKNVGLCPNPHNGASHLASYIGAPFDEVSYWCAGINHFSFYLEFKWRGQDAYPLLKEKFKGDVFSWPEAGRWVPNSVDLVEVEMLKRFGYFTNGGAGHIPYSTPYFMKRTDLKEKFKLTHFDEDKEKYVKRMKLADEEFKRQVYGDTKFVVTNEYRWSIHAANVIRSMETGAPSRINANVKNNGLITNLLDGCCVEVPCLVDKEGVHPCYVGDLPPQCAALIRTNINVQELAVRGIVEKDKNKIVQSILLDPLTSTILTIDETLQMVNELFQVNKEYMKDFK